MGLFYLYYAKAKQTVWKAVNCTVLLPSCVSEVIVIGSVYTMIKPVGVIIVLVKKLDFFLVSVSSLMEKKNSNIQTASRNQHLPADLLSNQMRNAFTSLRANEAEL